ncbi:XRE family transcriptional regulator [Entomomonas moraniae]|uniref:XRE family transcriptional regulator n=1 Tax=Entomomonas moraniae TaxID=2213226 RepID=A0A3Q9JL60_9GAMM|nr:helix-turn-helix transcriptional regulator [Entomomonas moraniae]AZS52085.1 XRE family transcriptional regulator [Entomomonas moraniae]
MTENALAGRLKEERKRLDMSQKEIAQKVSVNRETWSRYETAKMLPSTIVLLSAMKFGLDASYVLTGKKSELSYTEKEAKALALKASEKMTIYNNSPDMKLTSREQSLITCYREVNQEGKKTIDDIAKLLAMQQVKS